VLPAMRYAGNLQLSCIVIALLMSPAFAALVAALLCRDSEYPKWDLWPVAKFPALALAALAPLLFVAVYTITTLAGWTTPDWTVRALHTAKYSVDPSFFIVAGFLLSIVAGPTLLAVVCAGTELGWRAYLFPKLLPLGRIPAHLLIGLFTAVWTFPLVSLVYLDPKGALGQFPYLFGICVVVSAFLDELWLRTRHAGLTAVAAGCFLGQATGMWQYLFPRADLPFSGTQGVVSIVVWFIAAIVLSRFPLSHSASNAPKPESEVT